MLHILSIHLFLRGPPLFVRVFGKACLWELIYVGCGHCVCGRWRGHGALLRELLISTEYWRGRGWCEGSGALLGGDLSGHLSRPLPAIWAALL